MWETVPPIYIVSIYSSGEFFSFVLIAWNVEQEKTAISNSHPEIICVHLRSSVVKRKSRVGYAHHNQILRR